MTVRFHNNYTTVKEREETMYLITDFVITCYYNYERDTTPLDIPTLSKLLGVTEKSAFAILDRIRSRIFILGEERFNG